MIDPYLDEDLYKKDASYYIVNALNGNSDYRSFQSANYVDRYIRHADYKLVIDPIADLGTAPGPDDASFKVICANQNNCPSYKYTFLHHQE